MPDDLCIRKNWAGLDKNFNTLRSQISIPRLYFFEKFSNPPLIKFSIFLGEICKKYFCGVAQVVNEIYVARFRKVFASSDANWAFCICAGCSTANPNFRSSPPLIPTPSYSGPKITMIAVAERERISSREYI